MRERLTRDSSQLLHPHSLPSLQLCDDILRQMELRPLIGESVEAPPPSSSGNASGGGRGEPAVVTRLLILRRGEEGEEGDELFEVGGPDDMLTGEELCVTHTEVEYERGGCAVIAVARLRRVSHDGSRKSCTKTMVRYWWLGLGVCGSRFRVRGYGLMVKCFIVNRFAPKCATSAARTVTRAHPTCCTLISAPSAC